MQTDTQKNDQLKRYFPVILLVMLMLITILVMVVPNREAPETVGMIVSEQQPSHTAYPSSTAKPSATAQKPTQTPHYINTPTRTPTAYENQFVKVASLGKGIISSVFRSPQNEIAMILKDGVIHWYNGESLEPLGSIGVEDNNSTSISEVVFSRDNRLAAIGVPYGGYIIDLEHEELVKRALGGSYGSRGFDFSPENRFVAYLTPYYTTGGPYHSISLYSMETRDLIFFDPDNSNNSYSTLLPDRYHLMSSPSISPDGTLVAAGHSDYRVYVWELGTGIIRYLLEGHAADVTSVDFSPDGRLLASGSSDGTVRLWTAADGKLSRVITGFKDNVTEVRFGDDGRYLHVSVRSQPDSVFDLATGTLSEQLAVQPTLDPLARQSHLEGYLEESWPMNVRLSPDERRMAVSGNSHILVWDIEQKHLINSLEAPGIGSMEAINFSPNGEYLAGISRSGDILIWVVKSDEPLLFFDSDDLSTPQTQPARAYSQSIFDNKDVTFSPDNSQFLFTNGIDLELWDVRTAAHVLTLEAVQPPAHASRLSFSGDGRRIYAILDNNQRAGVWDAYSGKLIHEVKLTALQPGIETYFELHGHLFARNNQDDQTSWIELWNLENGEMLRLVTPDRVLRYLIFSPDGSRLTSLSGNIIYYWNTYTGKLMGKYEQKAYIGAYDINADGSKLALWNNKNVDLFHIHGLAPVNPSEATPTLAPLPTQISPEVQLPPDAMTISDANRISQLARFREGTIDHITWSADSTKVWASGSIGTFNYSFTPNSKVLTLENRSESVGWVSQSIQLPGGQVLGAGTAAGRVQVWDIQTGEVLFETEGSQPALSSNGEQLVYQRPDDHLQIVHLQDGSVEPILTNASEYSQYSRLPVFSPDGSLIAAVRANSSRLKNDDSIRVWNVRSGEIFNALGGPDHDIVDLSFSADGRLLVGAAGGSAWIWDVRPGFKPYQIQLYSVNINGNLNLYDQFVTAATLSPDNGVVAVGTSENTIHLYHRTSGVLLKELTGHSNSIHRLRFSPNGRFLLASDQDGTLVVWDVQTGRRISSTSDHAGAILGLNFNQGESLSAWTGGTVWTLKLPQLIALHSTRISHGTILAASPLGDLLAVNTPYQVSLFDAQTGEYIDLLEGEAEEPWVEYQFEGLIFRGFNEAAFSEDGTSLITKAPGGEWIYEQAETGAFVLSSFSFNHPLNAFTKVVSSPNEVWEGEINLLWGANVALLDPRIDRTIHSMSFSGEIMPSSLVFSPDSRLMIIGQSDGKILLVDVETFDIVNTLEGHRGSVDHLVFSPNGRYLISGSTDGTVRVWGVEN